MAAQEAEQEPDANKEPGLDQRVSLALAQHEVWQVIRDLKLAKLDLLLSLMKRGPRTPPGD